MSLRHNSPNPQPIEKQTEPTVRFERRKKLTGKKAIAWNIGSVAVLGSTIAVAALSPHVRGEAQQQAAREIRITINEDFIGDIEDSEQFEFFKEATAGIENYPKDIGEACLAEAVDLKLTDSFSPLNESASETMETIENAETAEQVVESLAEFYQDIGVDFHYHTKENPIDINDFADIDVSDKFSLTNPYDDTTESGFEHLKLYAQAHVDGLGEFTPEELNFIAKNVIFTGDSDNLNTAAFAINGWTEAGTAVFELNENNLRSYESIKDATVHEMAHLLRFIIAQRNDLYIILDDIFRFSVDIGTQTPDGFEYPNSSSQDIDKIAAAHPEWFEPGPDQAFASHYAAHNPHENFADSFAELAKDGLIGKNDDEKRYGSLLNAGRISIAYCRDTISPGWLDHAVDEGVQKLVDEGFTEADAKAEFSDYYPENLLDLRNSIIERHKTEALSN